MTGTLTGAGVWALKPAVADPQVENARTDMRRFGMLAAPLALLLVAFRLYSVEQTPFFTLACLVFSGFVISYWLPFRYKERFFIAFSLGGAYLLLSPAVATLLIVFGLLIFAVIRSGLEFRWKVLSLLGGLAILLYGRATGRYPVPGEFWPVFGAVFMFRTIIYLYDVKHLPGPPRVKDYLSYFFLLPNYYFLLFPVIDYQTFQKSYFRRDIHAVAEQGVWRIVRGLTHLLLYRVIYQMQESVSPPALPVAGAVAAKIVLCYLLYLRISGQFHIISGMLCLFGYDLPETNRRYLLAHSINDYWRRANIYWKDFMVKICYFPMYFKLRRKGELRAQLVATGWVFVVTWFLHGYQFLWLQGKFRFTLNDTLFWTILGSLVLVNVWTESKRRKRLPQTGWKPRVRNALQIAATFAFLAMLWSMWSADSLTEWFSFLRSGSI